jgi:hypothetical protein
MKIKANIELDLTVEMVADWFCDLSDEKQANFFIACGERAKSFRGGSTMQWHYIGRHLATCECSTFEARTMIEDIFNGMKDN